MFMIYQMVSVNPRTFVTPNVVTHVCLFVCSLVTSLSCLLSTVI